MKLLKFGAFTYKVQCAFQWVHQNVFSLHLACMLWLELHCCMCDFDQSLFRYSDFVVDAIDLDVATKMGVGLDCGGGLR